MHSWLQFTVVTINANILLIWTENDSAYDPNKPKIEKNRKYIKDMKTLIRVHRIFPV